MIGQRIGYIRVSTTEQNTERQLDNIKLDRTFIEKASGKDKNRPELEALMDFVREGDTIFVHSLDRMARNLEDLKEIIKNLTRKRIQIAFIKEKLTFTGEDAPLSVLMLSILGAFAEFERTLILERQREGIAIAKQKGVYKGRKKVLNKKSIAYLHELDKTDIHKSQLAKKLGVSRATIYNYLKKKNRFKPTF